MKAFYDKYASRLGEKAALKIIKKEIEKACDAMDKGGDGLYHLSVAHEMIEDLFEVKEAGAPAAYRK